MNYRAIFAIVRKDLKVASQNKGVMVPIIVLTVVFFVLLPWLTRLLPLVENMAGDSLNDIEKLLTRMPGGLQQDFSGLSLAQAMTVYVLKYMLAPMFLMLPILVASVIAADSFAGEKERKTLEALLYTPTTNRELFIAKLLSGWLAAIAVALVGFVLYIVMANAAAWSQLHRIFFPNAMWLVLILWVVPAIAGLGVGAMVLASSRAQGFQDANQLGGLVILPVVALFYLQVAGVMYFNV
ncbi:MAG: ABC transporter permease subunit, partial [Anaerolineales bacterium]